MKRKTIERIMIYIIGFVSGVWALVIIVKTISFFGVNVTI